MKSIEIRKKFFDFFKKHQHEQVKSSSLIPAQDPTLLFANAGMNQFKDIFLGNETRSYKRAVTIQKCVRAGGKHNDLDNVGFTKRHLTFFEMMGNFSFGDYFKKEAIAFAWNFLTKEMYLPADKLHASVFETDDESYDIWTTDITLPKERVHRLGASENFWQMGDTGPCGPCTELYIDRGLEFGCGKKTCLPGCECDRFLEIWNLVFMQYDRQVDGTNKPLAQVGVDTGMGLERLCSIMQNKDSVFETDLFENLIKKIEHLTRVKYSEQSTDQKAAFHVLCDHIRSSSLIIADGGAPSNEGRGYVLRKIIRRAALFTQKLTDQNIFPKLSRIFVQEMGDIYPELKEQSQLVYDILRSEIKKFAINLVRGKSLLDRYFSEHKKEKIVSGQHAFKLYDTFGFPLELIHIMAVENGFTVDSDSFEKYMQQQKKQSGKKAAEQKEVYVDLDPTIFTEFTGYKELQTTSNITALIINNNIVDSVKTGTECWVIAKKSPFFIIGGGQVPDQGWLEFGTKKVAHQKVRFIGKAIAAKIIAPTDLSLGDTVTSIVDKERRINAMKNHTGTHLLQAALIELFGKQIKQSGSLVHPDYLRFDFTHHDNLKPADIKKVEDLVNEKIRDNIPVNIEYTTLKDATNRGVIAFFGDKYNPEEVRIVQIADFSAELCGGTHVPETGMIGAFKIVEVNALSAGHRRIVALTGPKAIELFQESFDIVKNLSQEFKVKRDEIIQAVEKQKEQLKEAQISIKNLKKQLVSLKLPEWIAQVKIVGKWPFLFIHLKDMAHDELREIATQLLNTQHEALYFLISSIDKRTAFYVQGSPKVSKELNMKDFALWLFEAHGLRGGGSKSILQGGGGEFDPKLKESVQKWLLEQ